MTDPLQDLFGEEPATPGQPTPEWLAASHSSDTPSSLPAWLEFEAPVAVPQIKAETNEAIPQLKESPQPSSPTPLPNTLPRITSSVEVPVVSLPQRLAYGVVAKLSTTRKVYNFRVTHELPRGVQLISTEPKADLLGNRVFWNLGDLPAGKDFRLRVIVQPIAGFEVSPTDLTSFQAVYSQAMEFQTPLVRPKLDLTIQGPRELVLQQTTKLSAVVENQGNWPLEATVVKWILPPQLQTNAPLEQAIGTLGMNQPWHSELPVNANLLGPALIELQVQGKGFARKIATWEMVITKPELKITWIAPKSCDFGTTVPVQLQIENRGNAFSQPMQLEFSFDSNASWYGEELQSGGTLLSLPGLAPQEVKLLQFQLEFDAPGNQHLYVILQSEEMQFRESCTIGIEIPQTASSTIVQDFVESYSRQQKRPGTKPKVNPQTNELAQTQCVLFQVGTYPYAIPIESVVEVSRVPKTTRIPNVPEWLQGVANVRGDIVSIIDFRDLIQIPKLSANTNRLLVIREPSTGMVLGLIVDRVQGIRFLSLETRLSLEDDRLIDAIPMQSGIIDYAGQLIAIIDLNKVFATTEINPLLADR